MDWLWLGGEGPRDVPHWACIHLVTTLNVPWADINRFLSVQRTGFWNGRPVTFLRIYDPRTSEEALKVKDFIYLDQHPELILYEGYWEKATDRVFLECRATPKPQPQ